MILTRNLEEAYEFISANIVAYECRPMDRCWKDDRALYHNHANINDLELLYIDYGRRVEISTAPLKDIYILQVAHRGICKVFCEDESVDVNAEQWCLISPDSSYRMEWSEDCGLFELKIPRSTMERVFESVSGVPTGTLIRFEHSFNNENYLINHMSSIFSYLCAAAENDSIKERNAASLRQVEEMLVAMILENQWGTHSQALAEGRSALPRCLALAVEYMRANMAEPLTLPMIANQARTSIRNLNVAFRKFYDHSPMEYLKRLRLEHAYATLKRASAQDTRITSVAMDCGFRHMGRFAHEYYQRFGEYPHESFRKHLIVKRNTDD